MTNATKNTPSIHIGCAGWSIPKNAAGRFPPAQEGTHLERYARRLDAVEINSTFYRPHREAIYARWAASVPPAFRFAVKVPKEITHLRKLENAREPLERFLDEIKPLGEKLGPLLIQLPPGLAFDADTAARFFASLRDRFAGAAVCEPRHAGWFSAEAERLLVRFRVGRVAADPALPVAEAGRPGGWDGIAYFRLHGSPRTYYSAYPPEYLRTLAEKIAALAGCQSAWCVFDNTAVGAAAENALELKGILGLSTDHGEEVAVLSTP